jgi:hypothetical protein
VATIYLLAPVPERHLESGVVVCREQGRVAYGSRAFESFLKLNDAIKPSTQCGALIYAPDSKMLTTSPSVTWRATYVGFNNAINGAHKDGMRYRPPTTASDDPEHWAIFWEVADLQRLGTTASIRISELLGYDRPRRYLKNYIPKGPRVVEMA